MMTLRISGFMLLMQASSLVHAVVESGAGKLAESLAETKPLSGSGLSDPNMAGSLLQTTLGLLVVLAVIGGAAWAFKRFGNFQTGVQGKLKIVGGISLSARERVVLLQVGDTQLVVGVAPGQIQTLHVLDTPLPVDADGDSATSFSSKLQSAMARHVAKRTVGRDSMVDKSAGKN
ncbi:MAG: flagellar biosynthetic protein FliO [Gammaproteobacteria bacterium]|nr:flagellar biosynthetic protein FliO [Gammaproteobacteria bacterium]